MDKFAAKTGECKMKWDVKTIRLAFIGSGFMAQAMLRGLVRSGTVPPEHMGVVNPVDPETCARLSREYGVLAAEPEWLRQADVIFFAVKPQTFPEACQMYGKYFTADKLYLTIMAGVSCAAVEAATGNAAVVRFMPNLALSVQKSATAYCLGKHAGEEEAALAQALFSPLGVVALLPEAQLSAVTALSGSGPAYFYLLCEAMIESAAADGMNRETARALTVQTLEGAAALIAFSGESPTEMRRRITSKKGTTEAGVAALEEAGFSWAVRAGYLAARRRSDELGKQ